jgi:DNA primase
MISEVFGHYDDGGDFGRKWLSKNFLTVAVESRKPLELNLSRGEKRQVIRAPGFTEQELDRYRYYHPYMYERGLTDEIIEEFDIGFDSNSECITFPVYYADKTPAFVARRSVKAKFFNYPEGVEKPVYSAERFVSGKYSEAVICESFFNCLTCWKHGRPSMALIGTGTEYQYAVLRKLPVRKYVLAMDPDEAGGRAMAKLKKALGTTKVITYLAVPLGKDVNDCDEFFEELEEYL